MVKCHKHKINYKKVDDATFESQGIILKNVKAHRCPIDGEEIFSIEQAEEIRKRIETFVHVEKIERKISSAAGKKPILYLPEKLLKKLGLHIGDTVSIGIEGKKFVISPA